MYPIVRYLLKNIGLLFYIVDPKETYFSRPQSVPNYAAQVVPAIVLISLLEIVVSLWTNRPNWKFNDTITSLSQGIFRHIVRLSTITIEISLAVYIYNKWRCVTLTYNSQWIWFWGFLLVDFTHYWIHRLSHSINLLWIFHQVHHNSNELNLSTAHRESVVSTLTNWIFYVPLALVLPPSTLLVHRQLSSIYQIWIHTQVVGHLGPIEWIFNTPRHHRVNHGLNTNKNFGGTLIIWDRMFGTYASSDEKMDTENPMRLDSYSLFAVQFGELFRFLKKIRRASGPGRMLKLFCIADHQLCEFQPGKGQENKVTSVRGKDVPVVEKMCISMQFIFALSGVWLLMEGNKISTWYYSSIILFQVITCSCIGFLLDRRWFAPICELLRCIFLLSLEIIYGPVVRVTRIPMFFQQYVTISWNVSLIVSAVVMFLSSISSMKQFYVSKHDKFD